MTRSLHEIGFDNGGSETPTVPIVAGEAMDTLVLWTMAFGAAVYTNAALPPAVPNGRRLLRTGYMATRTDGQLDEVIRPSARFEPGWMGHGVGVR